MTAILCSALAALAVGYLLGRWRPAHRASDWANWAKYSSPTRHSRRWWLLWLVLSAENIGWLIAHPVQGRHAWQHRNDPPPKRGPAPVLDPDWARRRTDTP